MGISRESVVWGFRLILGREPESEEGIQAHMSLASDAELVEALLRSPEFRSSGRFGRVLQLREGAHLDRRHTEPHERRAAMSAVVLGNCQATTIAELLQAMTGDVTARAYETTGQFLARVRSGDVDLERLLDGADLILIQMVGELTQLIRARFPRLRDRIRQLPPLNYSGFHPDCVYVSRGDGGYLRGPMGEYQSSLAFWAWRHGLSPGQAVELFRDEVFEALGFFDYHASARQVLVANGKQCDLAFAPLLDRWRQTGCFMHTVNHPKVHALADVVDLVLRREGISPLEGTSTWVEDRLARWPVWPVYPELGERLELPGSYLFKLDRGFCPESQPVLTLSLQRFIERSFQAFDASASQSLSCARTDGETYQALDRFVRPPRSGWSKLAGLVRDRIRPADNAGASDNISASASPYAGLPDHRFWRRAVERPAAGDIDPVVKAKFVVRRDDLVATAGSCFAQHIARALKRDGFNYMVVDADASLSVEAAQHRGIGMYSARYGNVYTSRQLLQLFDRAHGDFEPVDKAWKRADGRFVDPFRPQIEPDGYARPADVLRETRQHLADVRKMFAELDVFVFTLGLTEGWRRRADGAVFPLAPGVAGGHFDLDVYEFVNFDVDEVRGDMEAFLLRLRGVNPKARVILTVSPVPLIATYADRHVLVSTAHSKAVLRAAAGDVAARDSGVEYFPSYEIITGPAARGRYFEDDLRSIRPEGVAHVMKVFFRHYGGKQEDAPGSPASAEVEASSAQRHAEMAREARALDGIVCDEEALDRPPPARH